MKSYFIILIMLICIQSNYCFIKRINILNIQSKSYFSIKSTSNKVVHQRLERIISNRGLGSRNDVAKLFKQGRISINGKVIHSGAEKYPIDVRVEVDGELSLPIPLLAIYHKPIGIHSVMRDPWGRGTLKELALEYPYLKSLHPVGRLDADTSGLLLFSSDGHLTQTLLHPSSAIEREYEAVVIGKVDFEKLKEVLAKGVKTTEGTFNATLLFSENLDKMVQQPKFNDKIDIDIDESDNDEEEEEEERKYNDNNCEVDNNHINSDILLPTSKVRVTVSEGKYRMVRRILHNAGHSVLELHRVRYGDVFLGDLEEGDVRECTIGEAEWAKKILK